MNIQWNFISVNATPKSIFAVVQIDKHISQ